MTHYSCTFELKEFPIREMVQRHFSFPAGVCNDANAGALGFKWLSRTEHLAPHILQLTSSQNFRGIGATSSSITSFSMAHTAAPEKSLLFCLQSNVSTSSISQRNRHPEVTPSVLAKARLEGLAYRHALPEQIDIEP